MRMPVHPAGPLLLALLLAAPVHGRQDCADALECPSSWLGLSDERRGEVFAFAEDYKAFIHLARTELAFVREAAAFAEAEGFEPLDASVRPRPGAKVYEINRDRTISLMVIGERPMLEGFHVIGAHIDSPRLELKARPLHQDGEFALLQTSFHGGIKYHQWTNLPLALTGHADRKDGSRAPLSVGLAPDEPVFMVPELSPHVDRGRSARPLGEHVAPEDLDPVAGHIPLGDGGEAVVDRALRWLADEHGLTRADLVSAELALVPAGAPRDVGFDRGLIAAYGQDDRLAAYAALRAVAEVPRPQKTTMAFLVDNEEVGNRNNTGARSEHFDDLLSRLLHAELGDAYREPLFRRALRRTRFVSIDVNPGVNPMNPGAWEPGNAPRLGHGVNLKMYGQGNNANSEFVAWTRSLLDRGGIPWQTATYKVGAAGGGTIGGEFSRRNIEVIDIGVPLLSIHTPFAVSSKVDLHSLYRAAVAFYAHRE